MKLSPVIVACLLVTTLVPAGAVGVANEPPLPEAGLDQTVTRDSTVLLDAAGSRDPDGHIVAYDWSVTSPTGRTVTPTNASAPRTTFEATTRGQYEVTLTVTDDDGAERTDTLYVTVTLGQAPRATVDGPDSPTVGTAETFTASFDRGAAPLERVVWRVDGTTVANRSLSSGQSDDSLRQTFGTTGAHTVSVKLVDTDGLTDTATTRLTARPHPSDPPDQPSIASQQSPTLDGPDLVTGSEPLRATYDLSGVSSGAVQSVRWHTEQGRVGSGTRQEVRWDPGDHRLYAVVTYDDDSSDVARFSDGSTTVVADPKPTVSLEDVTASGTITGEAVGTDRYENLQSVRVEVDGETVLRRPEITGRRGEWPRRSKHVQFTKAVQSFDEPSTVRVVATDRRGQTTTVSREVMPTGQPEIVESEFVNLPVDSYHERLDPERYAAKHVVTVELNGVDPENVSVKYFESKSKDLHRIDFRSGERRVSNDDQAIKIVSYWSGETPGVYYLDVRLKHHERSEQKVSNQLVVEPSPPEIRLTAKTDGTTQSVDNWGLVLDASRSFDPDGTDLKYFWGEGAHPIGEGNSTGELRSVRFATLVVEDGSGAKATQNHSYHQFFVPSNATIQPVDNGPYLPNETVTFAVSTNKYKFSKNRYETQIRAKPVGVDGEVKDWHKKTWKPTGKKAANNRQWRGTIEVPASELIAEDGAVKVYNQNNPERISVTHSLPEVTLTQNATPIYKIDSIDEVRYLIEREKQIQQTVESSERKLRLLTKGYNVTDSRITDREYVLEKRVKVRDAQYETETKTFRQSGYRQMFLDSRPEWRAAGTRRQTRTWSSVETEWRDSRTGDGQFTGDTRRKQVEPADYKRQYKYEYIDEETRTGTRTVQETRTRTVEETRTRTVERCFRFRCYTYDERYTVTDEEEYQVPVREHYTYTVTERETYWSFAPHQYGHERTGESRLIKISPAEYTTQYQYRFSETHQQTHTVYKASRQVQVAPPQYEWQPATTVDDELAAYQQSRQADYRLGTQSISKEWTLTKRLGTTKVISDSYRDEDNVIETRATVTGVVIERQVNPETKEFITTGTRNFEKIHRESGLLSKAEVRRSYRSTAQCADENPMRRWRCQ